MIELPTFHENQDESENEFNLDSEEEEYFELKEEKVDQYKTKYIDLCKDKTTPCQLDEIKLLGTVEHLFTNIIIVKAVSQTVETIEDANYLISSDSQGKESLGIITETIGKVDDPFIVCWVPVSSGIALKDSIYFYK